MPKSVLKIFLSGFFLLIALFLAYVSALYFIRPKTEFYEIRVGPAVISAELAKTPLQKSQGLSRRQSLQPNQGILFVYDYYLIPGFWMKEMNFPIDIIWIKDDLVVDLSENLPPEGIEPENIYKPSAPINYVLEVPAGYVGTKNIKVGDQAIIRLH